WSVGGSWNVSNESFMRPYSWIDMLKLRVTYGITGNVDQNSTPFLIGSMFVSSETGGSITDIMTPPNKLLRWEKTSTFNFGIDFAAWNRLNASVDVYKRYSSDLLAPKRYDPSMGFAEGWVNNGAMSNRGIEFSGSYDWIKTKNWRFTSQLTAAYNNNKIEKIDYEPSNALDLLKNPNGYYLTGTSRGTMYAYKYGGLNEVGDPIVFDENGNAISNDPVRSIDAVYAVGQLAPKWQGMLNLSVQYKNLELFTRFVYYTGHNMRYDVMPLYQGIGGGGIHRDIANRWTPSNQGLIPAIGRYGDDPNRGDHWKFADEHILTASYIRARNIGLTYTVPQAFLQKIGFKSAVLRAQVDNPFYFAFNGEGIDPESYDLNGGSRNNKIMPTYTFGINVSF
ncbi:MAG: TonB-dependent receptor domain-containing protein, partial [Bacteroidales bacterium]